ncbi:predicted protein, partial [Nematostella vectensis]
MAEEAVEPITELSNNLTLDLDTSDPGEIVSKLYQCDKELFDGWNNYPSMLCEDTIHVVSQLAKACLRVLKNRGLIVISGCGTSGRLAFATSKKFNALAKSQGSLGANPYDYLISGGDEALFSSREIPEDDWEQGQADLIALCKGQANVLYIGVTCGLSAPYVAGQLDYCLDNPDLFTSVLVGFNPVHMSRKAPIEGWSKTFYDVACKLQDCKNGIILNPVLGPEAITGSTRMKGGSATKMIIETALFLAHLQVPNTPGGGMNLSPLDLLQEYKHVLHETYSHLKELTEAVSICGESLKNKGHVYYVSWGSVGFLPLLDAAECVPTFSSNFHDIRAFMDGGFTSLGNKEGQLLSLDISLLEFENNMLPHVSCLDSVVFVCLSGVHLPKLQEVVIKLSTQQANIIVICLPQLYKDCINLANDITYIVLNMGSELVQLVYYESLLELSVKWVLNCLSTGAHILKGKVLQNYMIDLKVSNNKLFHRAISIISKFGSCSKEDSFKALLKSIYRCDEVNKGIINMVTSQHIRASMAREQVVPLAIL